MIYSRTSDTRSGKRGLGLAAQEEACQRYARENIIGKFEVDDPSILCFADRGVRAFNNSFNKRPMGGKLVWELESGDHIVFYDYDRAFRNIRDGFEVLETWRETGVNFHFVTMPAISDPMIGPLMMGVIGWLAQSESTQKSLRTHAINEELQRTEGRNSGEPPWYMSLPGEKRRGERRRGVLRPARVKAMFEMHEWLTEGQTVVDVARTISKRMRPFWICREFSNPQFWPLPTHEVKRLQVDEWLSFTLNPLLVEERGYTPWEQDCDGYDLHEAIERHVDWIHEWASLRTGMRRRAMPKNVADCLPRFIRDHLPKGLGDCDQKRLTEKKAPRRKQGRRPKRAIERQHKAEVAELKRLGVTPVSDLE